MFAGKITMSKNRPNTFAGGLFEVRVSKISYSSFYAGGKMTYANVPVIIPFLATGYLFTVYLLLVLAQRYTKNSN